MKFIRFIDAQGQSLLGAWSGTDTARLIEGELFDAIRVTDRQATIARLLPPLTPPNILAIGLNYRAHAAEGHRLPPEKPLIFSKLTTSVVGPNDPVVLPRSAPDEVDFEAELGIIIGRVAQRVSPDRALDYVFGYTALNDVTARDCQRRLDQQWTRAKSFDTFCPLGPCLVTADAIDPQNLHVRSWLNDEVMQDGHTSDMIFPCAELVSYLSHQFTLLPGTLICTGTPAGVGAARTPPRFLRAGDHLSVEVDGVGKLNNRVVASS